MTLRGLLSGNSWRADAARRVQRIYDAWEQDAEGVDEQYGTGGICDAVAEVLVDALTDAGIDAFTFHYEQDNHTVAIALLNGRTVEVDIPLHLYETGSWYNYKKREGVRFTASHVTVIDLGAAATFAEMAEES